MMMTPSKDGEELWMSGSGDERMNGCGIERKRREKRGCTAVLSCFCEGNPRKSWSGNRCGVMMKNQGGYERKRGTELRGWHIILAFQVPRYLRTMHEGYVVQSKPGE